MPYSASSTATALSHRGDSALARGVRSGVGASAADVDGCGVDDSAFGAVGDECTSRGLSAVEQPK